MTHPALILGCGRSGLAAARLLSRQGRRGWTVSDSPPESSIRQELDTLGFPWRGGLPEGTIDLAVPSPGFAVEHAWLKDLRERGVELVPEFELGARGLTGRQLAITGSLGKTSMAMLAAELLRAAGKRVTLSGNIGVPVCEVALETPEADVHVLELSSFQLEQSRAYRPDAALCLNLVPNHLDRHGSMEAYAAAKARLFAFQSREDLGWWPQELPVAFSEVRKISVEDFRLSELRGTAFERGPLRQNLRILLACLDAAGWLEPETVEPVIRGFRFPPHRMQRLEIPGAGAAIDDSKSTCLAATRAALESVADPVHLLMGGLAKGEPFGVMDDLLSERDVSLYLYGRCASEMREAWSGLVAHCEVFDGLGEAVEAAWTRRDDVATLLFSPGCASFDQYPNYMKRGEHFQRLVAALAATTPVTETP